MTEKYRCFAVHNILWISQNDLAEFSHIVSILDPEDVAPTQLSAFDARTLCVMRFHDIIESNEHLVVPNSDHIQKLLAFGLTIDFSVMPHILVHCFAGLSRSTAAALLLIAQSEPNLTADQLTDQLQLLAPDAWPNPRMVRIGDSLLGRNGTLLSAVHTHYERVCRKYPSFGMLMKNVTCYS